VAGAIRPGLTTVALPHEAMGRHAVEAALALPLPDGPRSRVVRLPGELVERASVTAPVRVASIVTLS
jgi:LacI family transcriptional regulator